MSIMSKGCEAILLVMRSNPGRPCTARCELSAIVYRQRPMHRRNVGGSSNGSRYPRSIRPTGCIVRWDGIRVPSSSPRVAMLGAPLGTGPAHVVQFWPVAVEGVRESVEQPRSAAMEESVDLCFIHVSGPSASRPFVALLQVGVLFIGAKHLCFEARSTRHR